MKELIDPRVLTRQERELLELLLTKNFPGREELRHQLESARVCGEYGLGDPTVVLCVDQSAAKHASVDHRIPVEANGSDSDGMKIHILVHVVDGFLAELEIYREDGEAIRRMPDPNSLEVLSSSEAWLRASHLRHD
jgi:hypothetical protein